MREDEMLELVAALADAKNRKDLEAAVSLSHADMVLETPALGSVVKGLPMYRAALERFFRTFPDYEVRIEGHASNGGTMICWGSARMTLADERLGVQPTGRTAKIPVMIQFTFADRQIASERFFYDLAALCRQSGVSTDAVLRHLFG